MANQFLRESENIAIHMAIYFLREPENIAIHKAIYFLREPENIAINIWLINVYENLKSLPTYGYLFLTRT